jgi:metallophosphoesterase superfamily enzyme
VRIGIVADIHDAVDALARALRLLRERGVDQVVTLGDAFETCAPNEPGVDVARLLDEAGAIGVWGNHDFALSGDVPARVRSLADPEVLAFTSRLQPQLVIDGCRFSHIEPWKDPSRIEDLWEFDGVPTTSDRAERSFKAVPERVILIGHFHSRLVVSRQGQVDWNENMPLTLRRSEPHLVLFPAVLEGWCGTLDTARLELTAIRCAP